MNSLNEQYRQRTKRFALDVIRFVDGLPTRSTVAVLSKQLLRAATSIAANYRAVGLARSAKERFAKLCIVVEETDETLFWLELVSESGLTATEKVLYLQREADELIRIFSAYRTKLKNTTP